MLPKFIRNFFPLIFSRKEALGVPFAQKVISVPKTSNLLRFKSSEDIKMNTEAPSSSLLFSKQSQFTRQTHAHTHLIACNAGSYKIEFQ